MLYPMYQKHVYTLKEMCLATKKGTPTHAPPSVTTPPLMCVPMKKGDTPVDVPFEKEFMLRCFIT